MCIILCFKYLSNHKSSVRPGDSTINQLSFLYHKGLDAKKYVCVGFFLCDVSKAFDKVWQRRLLYKRHKRGISGNLPKQFESYQNKRSQRVIFKVQHSSWGIIDAGAPQGFVLGPLLFLIYIKAITDKVDCGIKLLAGDSSLYVCMDNHNLTAEG